MRSLLYLAALLHVLTAWNISLSPSGERLQNRRSGENLLVVCKVKDYEGAASDVKVDWYRHGQVVSRLGSVMTIVTPYANQLLINRPKVSDGQQYVCRATIDGETQETIAEISFVDPPKFVDAQEEQHPEENTDAEIVCKVEGAEGLEVFWQFNGSTLDESSPRGYEFRDDKQILVIPKYDSKKDDGVYLCNAAQYSSFDTLSINVTGYSRPEITVFKTPEGSRGFETHSAELKCGAVGKPKPTYTWYNQEGEEIEDSDKYKVDDGLLVIEFLGSDDEGEYKCVAKNDIGEDVQIANISVFLKPKIERMVDITKKAGDEVEIVCKFHGDGELDAKFVFDDEEFKVGGDDEEDDDDSEEASTEQDQDNENDETVNDGEDQKDEEDREDNDDNNAYSTEKITDKEDVNAEDDDSEDEANDNGEYEEVMRLRKRSADGDRVSVREEDNSIILTLRDVTLEDAGAYHCVVSNEAGANNRSVQLAITHAPIMKTISDDPVRSFEGNTVTIFCEVSAVPEPTWTWTKDDDELEADGTSVIIDNTQSGTNHISRVTITTTNKNKNFGHYKCKAQNGIGSAEEEMEVMEIKTPEEPEGLDCKQVVFPNYAQCTVPQGLYDDVSSQPTELEFLIAPIEDITHDFEWESARTVRVDYNAGGMYIKQLNPSTQYQVRARALNEAGESDFIEAVSMETTEPWAPDEPQNVKVDCDEECTISWDEPNDHGSEIVSYQVAVQQLKENEETGEREDFGSVFAIQVDGETTSAVFSNMRPHSIYRIGVLATNGIGMGNPTKIEYTTDDKPTSQPDGDKYILIAIVAAGILALLLIIDLTCFCCKRWGIIACLCINCCGRSPSDRKERDDCHGVESGRLLNN